MQAGGVIMNLKLWLPFLLAPVIGALIGLHLFHAVHPDPVPTPDTPATIATPATTSPLVELATIFDGKPVIADIASEAEAAFIAALTQPPGPARLDLLQAAYTRWVVQAPVQALASIERLPAEERQQVVAHALTHLAQQRPEQFLTYANGITGHYTTYMAGAMGLLADSHPQLALALVQRNGERADPHGVVFNALLPGLIRSDLALAAETVALMQDRASIAHLQQVAAAYAQHDPKRAYDWVQQVLVKRTDIAPDQLLNDITGSLVAANPSEAANYLARTTDPVIRKSLLNEIAMQKGQDDLASAWTWLGEHRADAHYGETALNLLYRWSYTKPEEVAKILPTVADAQVQGAATTHLARFWHKKDPAGYQAWVASLPPGTIRDIALEQQ
jgi:hypothetical protein